MIETILIVSDLHLGAGEPLSGNKNPLEDFFYDQKFAELLAWKSKENATFELLILGDAFDFPQVLPEIGLQGQEPGLGTTPQESVQRLKHIIRGHPVFFDALKGLLAGGHTVRFLRGNHDIDLIWPEVRQLLEQTIGYSERIIFEKGYTYRHKGLYCEHGNQYSAENAFRNPAHPVVRDSQGVERLERCWGTYFMDQVYNDIETRFPVIDNVEDGQMIRGALLALKSGKFDFTGRVAGKMLNIAFRAGIPVFGWIDSWLMGAETGDFEEEVPLEEIQIETPEDLLEHLRDRELGQLLSRRCQSDPVFRRQLAAEVREIVGEIKEKRAYRLPQQDVNLTMGLFTGKNSYHRAAEKILRENGDIQVVVFGHTHYPINGNHPAVELAPDIRGKYFNSGSWTSSVDLDHPQNQGLSFDELCASGWRKDSLDFVEVTITAEGSVRAVLGNA